MAKKENKENLKETKLLTWDKIEFLEKKLNLRPREFYVLMSFRFLNISFSLVLICIMCIMFQFYKLHLIKIERSYYVTGIDGQVVNPKIDEEKYQKIVNALNQYYSEKNASQSNTGQKPHNEGQKEQK